MECGGLGQATRTWLSLRELVGGAAATVSGAGVRLTVNWVMSRAETGSEKASWMELVAAWVMGPAAV